MRVRLTDSEMSSILSIDSMLSEVIIIFLSVRSKKREVTAFLKELQYLLKSSDFNINTDFILIRKNKQEDKEHSTPYTLVDLEYDTEDVVDRLKELTVGEYSETKIDRDDSEPPLLFVFGKRINGKLIYIKVKIKDNSKRIVLCVSFHYAKNKMMFPYA